MGFTSSNKLGLTTAMTILALFGYISVTLQVGMRFSQKKLSFSVEFCGCCVSL